jgi:hypothetical protein
VPVIPATQEAEARRIKVQSQPQANSSQDSVSENAGGVAQGVVLSSSPRAAKKIKSVNSTLNSHLFRKNSLNKDYLVTRWNQLIKELITILYQNKHLLCVTGHNPKHFSFLFKLKELFFLQHQGVERRGSCLLDKRVCVCVCVCVCL